MRLTPEQINLLPMALHCTANVQADNDPGTPPWVDLEPLDGTDIHLLSVRFPGRCKLSSKKIEEMQEDGDTGDGFDGHAIGIFVVVLDTNGTPVFVRHSAAGALRLDRAGEAMQS